MTPNDTLDLLDRRESPSSDFDDSGIVVGTPEWDRLTRRRIELILRSHRDGLDHDETAELNRLQRISAALIAEAFPPPMLSAEDAAIIMKAIGRE